MRILALDIGEKRVGVAISDPLGWTAQGLDVLIVDGKKSLLAALEPYMTEYEVELILIGLPRQLNGELRNTAIRVKKIGEIIGIYFHRPVKFWDERLTTVEATKVLLEADLSRKRRKEVIDKTAATIILASYLQSLQNQEHNSEK